MNNQERKARLISALADYMSNNVAYKSINCQMGSDTGKEWAAVVQAVNFNAYDGRECAVEILNELFGSPTDQLSEVFRMQAQLNQRIAPESVGCPTEELKAKWLLQFSRATQQELAELIDSCPWKWWAKYQKFDEQNARVEIIDLFHFVVSMALVLGMTADDVFAAYLKKNQVNHQRQDTGYQAKDEGDSKHI